MTSILLLVYNVHTGSLKISRESLEVSSHRITNETKMRRKRRKKKSNSMKKEKNFFRRQTHEINEIRHTRTYTHQTVADKTVSISLKPICDSANARLHIN